MKIYTSRWANNELAHLDVVSVGISRGVPRWSLPYRYKLLRLLAPSREAFALQNLEKFEQSYLIGLEEIGAEKIAQALWKISHHHGGSPLMLLCFENVFNGESCHGRLFANWWKEQTGQEVPELDDGIEVQCTTRIQETLFETKEVKKGD